jgi:valyl-tRNA synthetase
VAETAYHFFWGELADWYLELVKPRLRGESGSESREAARSTLVYVLDGVLRLLHPLIPFVTEELWLKLPWPSGEDRPEALIEAPWPEGDSARADLEAEESMANLQELITQVRRLRKEYGVPEGAEVPVALAGIPRDFEQTVETELSSVRRLARVGVLTVDGGSTTGAGAHSVLKNGTELFLPLEGIIDLDRERERLAEEIGRLSGQLDGTEGKLKNQGFLEKAPPEVVQKEREKALSLEEQLAKLREKLTSIEGE